MFAKNVTEMLKNVFTAFDKLMTQKQGDLLSARVGSRRIFPDVLVEVNALLKFLGL